MSAPRSWDIFCAVVDNYGDIGVCWRLARQLVREHNLRVRLWVDRLDALHRIAPAVDPLRASQQVADIEVRAWTEAFPPATPHDVVVEAFGCTLPPSFVEAMARLPQPPLWINLEYLSAEEWVRRHHALASPHPSLPLVKYFYFPGFGSDTGGLLREQGLLEERSAFQNDPVQLNAFWRSLHVPGPQAEEQRLSLFAYENAAVGELLSLWAAGDRPIRCLVPEGSVLPQVRAALDQPALSVEQSAQRGALTVQVLPFLPQEVYDRLLWACDFNFVRGEDSFVRAQWAGRPFAWQIYPQQDEAHWAKLNAFLAIYSAPLAPETASAMTALWQAWNRQAGAAQAWLQCLDQGPALARHALQWAEGLARQPDLATALVQFSEKAL